MKASRPAGRPARLLGALSARRDILAVVAAGGAVGSLARWWLALLLPHPAGGFGWPTFVANVSGCLAIGVLMVFVKDVWRPSRYARPFLGIGVLGGYTTFSTAMLDTRALLLADRPGTAAGYLFGGLLAGLVAVWLGAGTARFAVGRRSPGAAR